VSGMKISSWLRCTKLIATRDNRSNLRFTNPGPAKKPTLGHSPAGRNSHAAAPRRFCSVFVTQITFSCGARHLVKNSFQLRGTSDSEGLPALRRYRICCQACGHKWQVRGHCIYPNEVSGLRRQWTEKLSSTFYRGLTARPVVLAKTYEPGASCFPP